MTGRAGVPPIAALLVCSTVALALAGCGPSGAGEGVTVADVGRPANVLDPSVPQPGPDGGAVGTGGMAAGAAGGTGAGTQPAVTVGGRPPQPGAATSSGGGSGGAGGGGGGGNGPGTGGGGTGATGQPPTGGTPPDGAAPASGSAPPGEEVLIGFQVSTDLQGAFGAVGAGGRPPEERLIVEALVEHVNATGGIAGRPVRPVIHETNPTSGTFASQAQAACATFTQDNAVSAVASSPVGGSDALLACLAPTGTPLVEQNHWWFDGPARDAHAGLLYQAGKVRPERGVAAMVDGLHDAGYFDGATTGLIRFDAPVFTRITEEVLKPELARRGLAIADGAEAILSTPGSVADFGSMNAEISNAIVRFRAAGVTHLLIVENAAVLSFFFTQQAEAAGFRPRYGLSTYNTPSTLANQAPPEQLHGSIGVGWSPPNDVFEGQHPGGNPTWQACTDVFAAAGLLSEYQAQGYYLQAHCDSVLLLREAFGRAADLTPQALRAAVDGLGSAYTSPMAFRTVLGPGRHDGGAAWRLFAYDEACACFAYTGPERALG
jgi:hypothetical protein